MSSNYNVTRFQVSGRGKENFLTCADNIYLASTVRQWDIPPGAAGVSPGKEACWKPALRGGCRTETPDFTRKFSET